MDKSLSNKELSEITNLNPTILSNYLKRLQKVGIVERNIDTRRYQLKNRDVTEETLFLNDLSELVQAQIKKHLNEPESRDPIFSIGYGFCMVENNQDFLKKLETAFCKPENMDILQKVDSMILNEWSDYVLSLGAFTENERKIIVQHFQMVNELEEMTKNQVEAKEKEMLNEPKAGDQLTIPLTLSETETKRYDEILSFLHNNQKTWAKFYNKRSQAPRTLIVHPALGFPAQKYEEMIDNLLSRGESKS